MRRPHAYKFAADHKGAVIPGIAILGADGGLIDAIGLPCEEAGDLADLIRGQ